MLNIYGILNYQKNNSLLIYSVYANGGGQKDKGIKEIITSIKKHFEKTN